MLDLNPQFPNNPNHKSNHHANHTHRFQSPGAGTFQFRFQTMEEDSGVCFAPLSESISPPDSPVRFTNGRALSPSSRAQAIARGRQEMMEMVENMPETAYELSLKDIVEHRRELVSGLSFDESRSMGDGEERSILGSRQNESHRWKENKKGSVKRQGSNRKIIVKNGSINNNNNNKGLLINMFFPFSVGSKKKSGSIRNSPSFGNGCSQGAGVKYPLKPELIDKSQTASGTGDRRDWWWKKTKGFSDSESLGITSSSSGESTGRSGSSGSSGSSAAGSLRCNSRKSNGCSYGCWSFFPSRKRKT